MIDAIDLFTGTVDILNVIVSDSYYEVPIEQRQII